MGEGAGEISRDAIGFQPSGDPATGLVDCCVHHGWATQGEVMEFMSSDWRTYLGRPGAVPGGGVRPFFGQFASVQGMPFGSYSNPYGDARADAYPPDGPPGSSYELVRDQLLDAHGVSRALLAHDIAVLTAALPNPHLAAAIAQAANDWTVARWLERDERFLGTVLVTSQLPDVAAAEIRRTGTAPRMAAVVLTANGLEKPLGHPVYHPIYEAAEECGLVVLISAGGNVLPDQLSTSAAAGDPATYAEFDALAVQPVLTHVVSLIAQGVFERFKALKVLVVGCGVTWIAPLLWRFDGEYKAMRREAPWMTRSPTEYFLDHIRVGTHPLEPTPPTERLRSYLEAFEGLDRVLCYASGYPRWHWNAPEETMARLPPAWRADVARDNAVRLFGLAEAGEKEATCTTVR